MRYIALNSSNSKAIYCRLKNIRSFCLMNFYVLQYIIANASSFGEIRPSSMPYISYNEDSHRICIFKSANQYFSFSFPYNYKTGKWYSILNGRTYGSKEITPEVCSHIITLLNKWNWPYDLKQIIEFDAYMDPGDNRIDWEYASAVLQSRIIFEAGYLRHDDDSIASMGRELLHPRRHYDINYHEYSKLKFGKFKMDSVVEFENLFDAGFKKHFLYKPQSPDEQPWKGRSKNLLKSPFRKQH